MEILEFFAEGMGIVLALLGALCALWNCAKFILLFFKKHGTDKNSTKYLISGCLAVGVSALGCYLAKDAVQEIGWGTLVLTFIAGMVLRHTVDQASTTTEEGDDIMLKETKNIWEFDSKGELHRVKNETTVLKESDNDTR